MLTPVKGMCFVIEDQLDFSSAEEAGIIIPEIAKKNMGVSGRIYSVGENGHGFTEGDRVVFSKFIAEQIHYEHDGELVERLVAVPIDAILGTIT